MERGSDKHGPALDDQMRKETESIERGVGTTHVEEWRQPEPLDDDTDDTEEPAGD